MSYEHSTNASAVSTTSSVSRLASTIKRNQHIVLSIVSLMILIFSMIMILLNSLGMTSGGSDSVYFSLISNIIGLFTPMPSKNGGNRSQITNETQTGDWNSPTTPTSGNNNHHALPPPPHISIPIKSEPRGRFHRLSSSSTSFSTATSSESSSINNSRSRRRRRRHHPRNDTITAVENIV